MDERAIKTVQEGFQTFMPVIQFHTSDYAPSILYEAKERDPKIRYYLQGYDLAGSDGNYELTVRYMNKAVSRDDVKIVSSQSESEEFIRQYVEELKEILVIIARPKLDTDALLEYLEDQYIPPSSESLDHARTELWNHEVTEFFPGPDYSVIEIVFEYIDYE